MKNKLLVVFLSCKKNSHLWNDLLKIVPNSLIFYGNSEEISESFSYENRILELNCKDTYDYLSVKILLMIKSILKIDEFNDITHILKIDDHDTKLDKNINITINKITLTNYCGQKLYNSLNGDRTWHFNKVPLDSIWHNKEYAGNYVPWIDGGCGYILSRKSMNMISNEDISKIFTTYIYEDVMVALLLRKNKIFPKQIKSIIKGDKK